MLRNGIRELERRQQAWTLHCPLLHRSARTYIASQTAVATPSCHDRDDVLLRVRKHDRISQTAPPRRGASPAIRHPASPMRNHANEPLPRRQGNAGAHHMRDHQQYYLPRRYRSASHRARASRKEDHPAQSDRDNDPAPVQDRPGLGWSHTSMKLSKSWRHMSPNILLKKVLEDHPDSQHWRHRVALARSNRLPVVLLQMYLRSGKAQSQEDEAILVALPSEGKWRRLLAIVRNNGYDSMKLDSLLDVLRGATDEERCHRALALDFSVPNFLLNFLVRRGSNIRQVSTLNSMIGLWRKSCRESIEDAKGKATGPRAQGEHEAGSRGARNTTLTTSDFDLTTNLLAYHCTCIEPRLSLKLADTAMEYIRGLATISNKPSEKLYQDQCVLFNMSLRALQPQPRLQAAQVASPNAFYWEAQRVLLAMSAEMERSLLVNREGFQAIRVVLSGLAKNRTETRNARRHASTWPPYLEPADGMDEIAEPEDSWSRAVNAGVLMQEAGFSKEDRDSAMDILGGMAMDGSPTIQQRTAIARGRSLSSWEASIRATRNAHEAWHRFRNPPEAGLLPGVSHYAAMFEKLVLREVDAHTRTLPGDKWINFPVHHESNLTEFEQARLQPPSVAQLFERMIGERIRPTGNCLHVLVANASSLEVARNYIYHSPERHELVMNLYRRNPDPVLLRELDCGLVAAYIQALTAHEHKRMGNQMRRAIRLARNLVGTSKSPLAQNVWAIILKNLSQHHEAMQISLGQQLRLLLHVVDQMGGREGVTLRGLIQFSKGIRKAIRREVEKLAERLTADEASASEDPLLRLYSQKPDGSSAYSSATEEIEARPPKDALRGMSALLKDAFSAQPPDALFRIGAARMKELHDALRAQETESQRLLDMRRVAPLDRMSWRKDLFRSDHAHEFLLSLAFAGEFAEMAAVLRSVAQEWDQPDVGEALLEADEIPPHADFFEALCAFRVLAEPMLDAGVAEALRDAVLQKSRVGWAWPDEAALETYMMIQEDGSTATLARVLEWVRLNKEEGGGGGGGGQQRDLTEEAGLAGERES